MDGRTNRRAKLLIESNEYIRLIHTVPLLGTQFFLGIAVTQNVTYSSQKSLSFKENDLNLISNVPHQGYGYNEELFFPTNLFFIFCIWFKVVFTDYVIATSFFYIIFSFIVSAMQLSALSVCPSVHPDTFVYVWAAA